jgi:DHA1 family inner membrane transport protein
MAGRRAGGSRLVVGILVLGSFSTALNTGMLSPLLPAVAADFGTTEAIAGQLGTLGWLVAALVALGSSAWMDRYSRGAWLRAESVLLAAGTLLSALAPSLGWLFVGRALAGAGGAVIMANCLAACSDLFPDSARRNRAVGMVVSATTVALVGGLPLVTQVAALSSWRWAMALLLVPLALLFVGTRRLPTAVAPTGRRSGQGVLAHYREALRHGESAWLLVAVLLIGLAYFGWLNWPTGARWGRAA